MIEYHRNSGVVIDTIRFLSINTPIVGSNWGQGPKKLGNSNEALVISGPCCPRRLLSSWVLRGCILLAPLARGAALLVRIFCFDSSDNSMKKLPWIYWLAFAQCEELLLYEWHTSYLYVQECHHVFPTFMGNWLASLPSLKARGIKWTSGKYGTTHLLCEIFAHMMRQCLSVMNAYCKWVLQANKKVVQWQERQ